MKLMVHFTGHFQALSSALAAQFTFGWLKSSARHTFDWLIQSGALRLIG